MRRTFAGCIFAALTLTAADPALAVSFTGEIGGPHDPALGIPDSSLCPLNAPMIGITGMLRNIGLNPTVAAATALCAGGAGSQMGEGPGPAGTTMCAPGQVVVGIAGRDGDFIDHLSVRCRPAAGGGATTTATGMGGVGGSVAGPFDCPAGRVAVGFTGEVIDWNPDHIRYLRLVCA